jgi:biopolymer transport protein ExbB
MRTPALVLLALGLFTTPAVAAAGDDVTLWGLIVLGGWAMWPLGLCSLAVFALTIHAVRETRRARFIPHQLLPQIESQLGSRLVDQARALVRGDRTVLARILHAGLERARPDLPDANKSRVEETIAEGIEHEENAIMQWVNYLNVVATIAPMIGLLGTVSGMIGAFQTISAGGMGRPELLAGDIGEALITTAAGLIIGIPAMLAYFILRNRLGDQIVATVQIATRLVDRLSDSPRT